MTTHTSTRFASASSKRAVLLASIVVVASGAGAAAWAQNVPVEKGEVTIPANVLTVGEIEARLTAQGIKVKEIEVRDLLAEVEGYDAQGREVELTIDRRNGETLAHEYER